MSGSSYLQCQAENINGSESLLYMKHKMFLETSFGFIYDLYISCLFNMRLHMRYLLLREEKVSLIGLIQHRG